MRGSVVEHIDNRIRKADELAKRPNRWLNVHQTGIVESYLNSDLNLVVRIGRHRRQAVAVFRCLRPDNSIELGRQAAKPIDSDARIDCFELQQLPMFSGNVHLVQAGKQPAIIPSVVWLELLDDCLICGRKPLYFFESSVLRLRPFGDDVAHRKIDVFSPARAVSLGKFNGEMIQAASDRVNDESGIDIENPRCRFNYLDFQRLIAGFRIFCVKNSSAWAVLKPSGEPVLEDVELGYGPFD